MNPSTEYVPVTRYFRNASEDPRDGATRRMLRAFETASRLTWRDLLLPSENAPLGLVVLAPSGAGKSTELAHACEKLNAAGQTSFLCEAGAIATEGLRAALGGARPRFESWSQSTSPAVLFVDAADEVYLRQRRFGDVARALDHDIDFEKRTVQVVVTARTGAWSASDRRDVEGLLARRLPQVRASTVILEPVDDDAIAMMATAAGVGDVNKFMRAFEDDEIYNLVDLRPMDALLFIEHWKKHGAFGSWSELLGAVVEATIAEEDPARRRNKELPDERHRAGLERVAAASVLMKRPHLSLPSARQAPDAINARRLFADWEPALSDELFSNGLFVHKGEDALQLPQGALSEFLAARWFATRFRAGLRLDLLREALLVRVFGSAPWQLPGSREALAGWIASAVPELRSTLLDVAPWVLLHSGDPSRLSNDDVHRGLEKLVEIARRGERLPSASKAIVRQLARPELEEFVHRMLVANRNNDEVAHYLLRYAELGRYASCLPHALDVALDGTAGTHARLQALAVVARLGSYGEKTAVVKAVAAEDQNDLRSELVRHFVPDVLAGPELVRFITTLDDFKTRFYLERVLDRVSTDDIDGALSALYEPLSQRIIGKEVEEKARLAATLVLARLQRGDDELPMILGRVLVALERLSQPALLHDDVARLRTLLAERPRARRMMWAARIARGEDEEVLFHIVAPEFGALQPDDLAWLFEQHEATQNKTIKQELLYGLDKFYTTLTPAERGELVARADLPDGLKRYFAGRDEWLAQMDALAGERARQKDVERARTLRTNQEVLAPKKAEIEAGDNLNVLVWAWQQIEMPDTSRARVDLSRLRELVGDDLVDSLETGFRASWRKQEVPIPTPGVNSTPIRLLVGLTGLTLDFRAGLQAAMLSDADAELAARYAMYELNAFPYWIDDLAAAKPEAVRRALEAALRAEWTATVEHHGAIRFADRAPERVAALMREIVLKLIEAPPGHPSIAREAGDALLVAEDANGLGARLVAERLNSATTIDERAAWLRAWAHLEPIAAADWAEQVRAADRALFDNILTKTAELLEWDFDGRGGFSGVSRLTDTPNALERWVRVLHLAVRPEDDVYHEGAYVAGTRDQAEDFRRRCLTRLAENPSFEAHAALDRLRRDPELATSHDFMKHLAFGQMSRAIEAAVRVWTEEDVLAVERGDERRPSTLEDLFELTMRHLARVGELVENDDFSYRAVFGPSTPEKHFQLWVASCLRLVSRGLYTVVREPEVDDDKKIDIAVCADGIGRVPVEIKPLGDYSLNALKVCITDQLYGKYMQPSSVRYGVLLLIRHESRRWEIDGALRPFDELVAALRAFADDVGQQHGKVIRVATIDMLPPGSAAGT